MTPQERSEKIVELLREAAEEGTPFVGHFEILNLEGKPSCSWSISWNDEVDDLFAIPCHKVADVLGVLGNEVRLAILRELISGPKTVLQLTESLGMQTTGQAYHHLKELQRAGYVGTKKADKYSLDMKFGRIYVAALALAWNAGAAEKGIQES
jgi:DNA-binding transcriptional ArsR family regulator